MTISQPRPAGTSLIDGPRTGGSRAGGPRTGGSRIRASDAERDQVVAQLREHFAAGRLTAAESQDRIGRALEARTMDELDGLTSDLPVLGPAGGSPARAVPGRASAPEPWRAAGTDSQPAPEQDTARLTALALGIIVAAYGVTWLLTGIWWLPWALVVVPAVLRWVRRTRSGRWALSVGAGHSLRS
jgi:Flp pilus assembly protein TadB